MRFLIAEGERALGSFLARGMESEGHEAILARDGEEVLQKLEEVQPDIVILDLNLPKRDGTEVLRAIRAWRSDLPLMVLTSRADLETRIVSFDLGADDFMAKPFSLRELRARCRALLRRPGTNASTTLRCGELELNRIDRTVKRGGQAISLTNKEFALLECLMASRGRCVSRTFLLEQVWQAQSGANTNVVDVYVNYLRRKLGETREDSLIRTVRGIGYSMGHAEINRNAVRPSDFSTQTTVNSQAWGMYGNSFGTEQPPAGFAGQL